MLVASLPGIRRADGPGQVTGDVSRRYARPVNGSQTMPSTKRLNSVCHSIAHHAVSGLSFIHPHVLETCRSAGVQHVSIDLLDPEPCPKEFRVVLPLLLSLRCLRTKLDEILTAEGFSLSDLSRASLTFFPDPRLHDDCSSICHSILTTVTGRTYEHVINCLGEPQPKEQYSMSTPQ